MEQTKTDGQQRLWQADRRARQRRQWALDHPEQTRSYGRAFYRRNTEERKASSVAYYHAHKAERNAYSREYYLRRKAQDPDIEGGRTGCLQQSTPPCGIRKGTRTFIFWAG